MYWRWELIRMWWVFAVNIRLHFGSHCLYSNRWEDNIKMDLKVVYGKVWTGFIWLLLGTAMGSFECHDEHPGSLKWRELPPWHRKDCSMKLFDAFRIRAVLPLTSALCNTMTVYVYQPARESPVSFGNGGLTVGCWISSTYQTARCHVPEYRIFKNSVSRHTDTHSFSITKTS